MPIFNLLFLSFTKSFAERFASIEDRACRTTGRQGAKLLPGIAGAHNGCRSSIQPEASGSSARDQSSADRYRCKTASAARANPPERPSRTRSSSQQVIRWDYLV